jgi:tRNA A-37 threonylcarbamoyl transferase component Bud32
MTVPLTKKLAENIIKTKKWRVKKLKLLGAGVNGRVYDVGTKALKIMKGTSSKEYLALKRLQGSRFTPKVKVGSFFKNTQKGISGFLMNKIPSTAITLNEFHRKYKDPNETAKMSKAIKAIHSRGVSQGDLHDKNIMVLHSGNTITKIWIIDFGRSIRIPKGMTEKNVYALLTKVKGYNKVYGNLFGNQNAPSRPNYQMRPNLKTAPVKSKRLIVKSALGSRAPRSVYYKSAAYTI